MKTSKKLFIAFMVIFSLAVTSFGLLTGCEEEVTCGGNCSDSHPWSNGHTSSCYTSQSNCESATGHGCQRCN